MSPVSPHCTTPRAFWGGCDFATSLPVWGLECSGKTRRPFAYHLCSSRVLPTATCCQAADLQPLPSQGGSLLFLAAFSFHHLWVHVICMHMFRVDCLTYIPKSILRVSAGANVALGQTWYLMKRGGLGYVLSPQALSDTSSFWLNETIFGA